MRIVVGIMLIGVIFPLNQKCRLKTFITNVCFKIQRSTSDMKLRILETKNRYTRDLDILAVYTLEPFLLRTHFNA